MNMPMCSRCGKNVAVVFITKIDQNNNSTQEGLCLKCAKEMGLKPIDNLMEQMGITDADLDALAGEISAFGDLSGLVPAGNCLLYTSCTRARCSWMACRARFSPGWTNCGGLR